MNISNIVAATQAQAKLKAQGGNEPVAEAFKNADKRIAQQREAASVELSSLGKVQSSLSEAQAAARAVSSKDQTVSDADLRKQAQRFAKTFSTAVETARLAAKPAGGLAAPGTARAVESDLVRAIGKNQETVNDLKNIGITLQTNGTLAIDSKKFDAALEANPDQVRSTLAAAGRQVDQTVTRELAANGNIGRSVSSATTRAQDLETRQQEQQAQAVAAQQAIKMQVAQLANSQVDGATAYQRIFSL